MNINMIVYNELPKTRQAMQNYLSAGGASPFDRPDEEAKPGLDPFRQ